MIYAIFYPSYDECRSVCMNFIRLFQMRVKVYVDSVGWRPPASLCVNWSTLSTDRWRRKFIGHRWRYTYYIVVESCVLCQYLLLCCFLLKIQMKYCRNFELWYSIFHFMLSNQTLEGNQSILPFCSYQTQEQSRPVTKRNHSILTVRSSTKHILKI